jgi:CSLREA domain-containing protein
MRRFIFLNALCIALALGGALAPPPPPAAAQSLRLRIDAPATGAVGQALEVTLSLEGATDLGGYEALLAFEPGAASFGGLLHLPEALQNAGREPGPLGPVERAGAVAFGAYSCPFASCIHPAPGTRRSQGATGDLTLATLSLIPHQSGTLELSFAIAAVDAAGAALGFDTPTQTVRIQIDTGAPLRVAAAARMAIGTNAGAAQADLTGDGRVSNADLMEAALAWTHRREAGDRCTSAPGPLGDVNGDGCVDIVDLQALADGLDEARAQPLPRQAGPSFSVTSAGDEADASPGDGVCASAAGTCTLRAAIQEANLSSGANRVEFSIPGPGPHTILLAQPLPSLSDESGPTTIDGYSQPGAAPNSDSRISNAALRVQLSTVAAVQPATIEALHITAPGNTVRGLALFKFRRALFVFGNNADSNTIVGNFIGTDAGGSYFAPAIADSGNGVELSQGASRNRIGGTSPADRNVISGNAKNGVASFNGGSDKNLIIGNLIGLAPAGDRKLPNFSHGIDVNANSANNQIGGSSPGERNVIAGNGGEGVEVSHGQRTQGNSVIGNYIGADATGALTGFSPNGFHGVHVEDGPTGTQVGLNLIVGNVSGGLLIDGLASGFSPAATQVFSNQIGLALDGSAAPNANYGIRVADRSAGSWIGPGNIIAHSLVGVQLEGPETLFNTISRNSIFGNQLGIDLVGGANVGLAPPQLAAATPAQVEGSACAGCLVEVFLADTRASLPIQGQTFLGATTAASDGRFSLELSGLSVGALLTATTTDAQGNSSQFADGRTVAAEPGGSPTPTPTPTPPPAPTPPPPSNLDPKLFLPLVSG